MSTLSPSLDRATLARLYDQHGPKAYGLAHQITGRVDVAGALTESAFSTLARHCNVDEFEARLLAEVHRLAVAWVRHSASTAASPSLTTGDQARLADLPEDERVAIANAYFGGSTYTEIAAGMQVGAGQVADLLRRGLSRLAEMGESSGSPAAQVRPQMTG